MNYTRVVLNTGVAGYAAWHAAQHLIPDVHTTVASPRLEDDNLRQIVMDVAKDMNIKNPERLHLCTYKGYYPRSHGYLDSPGGAYLQLPECFGVGHLYPGKNRFGWEEEVYRTLRPSDNSRIFSIAHELNHVQRGDSLIRDALATGVATFMLNARHYILNMSSAFAAFRTVTWVGGVVGMAYLAGRIFYRWAEFKADREAAMLGKRYADGGVRWCEKVMQSLIVVRAETTYGWLALTPGGDSRFSLGRPYYRERLHELRKILDTCQSAEDTTSLSNDAAAVPQIPS